MKFYGHTDIGRVRKENQDSYLILNKPDKGYLFGVFDGVGGCDDGKAAAIMAQEAATEYFINNFAVECDSIFEISENMRQMLFFINSKLRRESEQKKKDFFTTVSILFIKNDNYFIGHIGDSKILLLRNREIFQTSHDDNLSKKRGEHYSHVLTQVMGQNQISPQINFESLFKDDFFILCSDGLTSYLSREDILKVILNNNYKCDDIVYSLIDKANEMGGKDNITVISVKV
ncbi:MAG: PP2C family protein-serine/threonine phosphatase [Candidatus Muiribacteriota bacterium]